MSIETLDPNFASQDPASGLHWYDIRALGIEGRGFSDTTSDYHRLPTRAEALIPEPVWRLSQLSAGLRVRFVTDAPSIAMRWTVTREPLTMPHMAATGGSGFDLYWRRADGWRFAAVARPREYPANQEVIIQSMTRESREFLLHLPLYNGVEKAEIGISPDASLAKAPPWPAAKRKPIVFYGTSIVHGGCASRPGMCHTNILGRLLDWPTINLGFSGNGKSEPELADLLAEIDAAIYVVDPLPNMNDELATERLSPFIRILRAARPQTPIVMVGHYTYSAEELVPWKVAVRKSFAEIVGNLQTELAADGIPDVHFLSGEGFYDAAGEGTVDGSHPTDLGFMHMAHVLAPLLQSLLPSLD
ncbi:MAG: SGNH/GDSL hydrolase family protein [Verrucomicrobia bacterium]|nr:SGNH/GDSL hydrolase family protein [Verrucomicrobiota bacterium]